MLTLIRGLPGAGKTTRAREYAYFSNMANSNLGINDMVSADDFMPYPRFDPTLLASCHKRAQERCRHLLSTIGSAVVHNTFTQRWEMQPYIDMAKELNININIVSLFDGGLTDAELAARNVHNVPEAAIKRMRDRWEK